MFPMREIHRWALIVVWMVLFRIIQSASAVTPSECALTYSEFELDSAYANHWWLDDSVALVLTTTGTLYKTSNQGASWQNEMSKLYGLHQGVASVKVSSTQAYIVGVGGSLWRTENGGDTYHLLSSDAPEFLRFHVRPDNHDHILAAAHAPGVRFDFVQTYLSTDGGLTWTVIETYTAKESWGSNGSILLLTWADKTGLQQLKNPVQAVFGARALPMAPPNSDFIPYVQQAADFGYIPESNLTWVVQYTGHYHNDGVDLLTSTDGHAEFHAATFDFPASGKEPYLGYTLLDTTEGSIFINIQHTSTSGSVFVSDKFDRRFVPTLTDNYRNSTNVEFTKVEGLLGVYIANVVQDSSTNTVTLITWNAGGRWQRLRAPDGECSGRAAVSRCSLHFYGVVSHIPQPVASQARGVGLLLGVGRVGESLQRTGSESEGVRTFLSRDAGVTWTAVADGSHLVNVGDHGGLLVLAASAGKTIQYSLDEGTSFQECGLSDTNLEVSAIFAGEGEKQGSGVKILAIATDRSFNAPTRGLKLSTDQLREFAQLTNATSFERDLQYIAVPRRSNSTGNDQVRAYLINELGQLGWSVETDAFVAAVPAPYGDWRFTNVLATRFPLNYSKHQKRIVISAHFDSLWIRTDPNAVLATDSAGPCAILLDLARTLTPYITYPDAETFIQLIFFDGEEAVNRWSRTDSLYGSMHLAQKWETEGKLADIELFVLLDLLGESNPQLWSFWSNTQPQYEHMQSIESALSQAELLGPTHSRAYFRGKSRSAIEDDHLPFIVRGVPIVHLISYPFPRVWHTSQDDLQHLDRSSLLDLAAILRVWTIETITPVKHLLLHLDFSEAFSRFCKADDYEDWELKTGYLDGSDCILGQKYKFSRRKQSALCRNGRDWERPTTASQCPCTYDDYLCDECYDATVLSNGSARCVLRDGCAPPTPPEECPYGYYWNRTQGYLPEAGNMCNRQTGVDLFPVEEDCAATLSGIMQQSGSGVLVALGVVLVLTLVIVIVAVGMVGLMYGGRVKEYFLTRRNPARDAFDMDDL